MINRHGQVVDVRDLLKPVLLVLPALLLSACIARSEDAVEPASEDGVTSPGFDTEGLAAAEAELDRLVDIGEIDGVVRMLPPSRQPVPAGLVGMGPNSTVVSQRAILSFPTPNGRAEMFETIVRDADMGPGLQRCLVVVEGSSAGAGCGPANDMAEPSTGLGGASGSDTGTLYELVGPVDMTHFIVEVEGQRLAVVTREGHALLYVAGGFCTERPSVESAWRGDEELVVTAPSVC